MEQIDNSLPVDFDGVFRFTNFTEEDFKARWNNVEYTFLKKKRTPIIIPTATPQEIQHIRKKFARELAILEWYKTKKFEFMNSPERGQNPATYTDSDLAPFIQKCLEPLPIAHATVKVLPKDDETKYRKDNKGRNVTKVLEQDDSLIGEGTPMAG